jgi:hypothetical protein
MSEAHEVKPLVRTESQNAESQKRASETESPFGRQRKLKRTDSDCVFDTKVQGAERFAEPKQSPKPEAILTDLIQSDDESDSESESERLRAEAEKETQESFLFCLVFFCP